MTSHNIFTKVAFSILFTLCTIMVSAQEQGQKDPEEIAIEQAEKFERSLSLLPHQAFFIDSIMRHDMVAMSDEMKALQNSGTQEYTAFKQVRDKWLAQIDSSFKKVLDEEQWIKYLKMTGKYVKPKKEKSPKKKK